MVNYVGLAATAKRLIDANGADWTLTKITKGEYDPDNNDRTTDSEDTQEFKAVLLGDIKDYNNQDVLLNVNEKTMQKYLLCTGLNNPSKHDTVTGPDGTKYDILLIDKLKPADTTIYYQVFIEVLS